MTFFNIDDQAHSHPKFRKAGLAAVGLWTMAGSWSQAHKQEGFVPDWFVISWPRGTKLATELVHAGLWDRGQRDALAGYQFHDWLDIHATADEIELQRQKSRERQRARRKRLANGGETG